MTRVFYKHKHKTKNKVLHDSHDCQNERNETENTHSKFENKFKKPNLKISNFEHNTTIRPQKR